MALSRGIVAGWDLENDRPMGVTTAAEMRDSLNMIATGEGIMYEMGAAQTTLLDNKMGIAFTPFTIVIKSLLGGWYTPRVGGQEITFAIGDPTYDRIDAVWVKQWDYQADASHPNSEPEINVTAGVPTASPERAPIPNGAVLAFQVRIPRNATVGTDITTITRAPWVSPTGGIITVGTNAEMVAAAEAVAATPDQPLIVYMRNSNILRAYDGTTWTDVIGSDTGWVDVGWSVSSYWGTSDAQARRIGGIVYWRRRFIRTPAMGNNRWYLVYNNVPAQFRPSSLRRFVVAGDFGGNPNWGHQLTAYITGDGTIEAHNRSGATLHSMSMDSVCYPAD